MTWPFLATICGLAGDARYGRITVGAARERMEWYAHGDDGLLLDLQKKFFLVLDDLKRRDGAY